MDNAEDSRNNSLKDVQEVHMGDGKKHPRIALQLYTIREPAKKDLNAALKRARDTGFEFVQWSGMPELPAPEIRAALDAAGLKAIAGHYSVEAFEKDFDAAVTYWKTIGAKDVAPGGMMDDCRADLAAWLRGAARLDALGAKLNAVDMRLSYHNHAAELEKFPGDSRAKLDVLYESTSPKNLYCEFDTAWIHEGGADTAGYLRKYKGRCPVIHVKDVARDSKPGEHKFCPLGKGVMPWDEIFGAAEGSDVQWYVYEQDTCEGDPFDSVRISYDFLRHYV